jgi:hypothetical protein
MQSGASQNLSPMIPVVLAPFSEMPLFCMDPSVVLIKG